MASSFERAFNPAFQASMASAMRDMADEKAEKRMQEKLLEQRAYNTMEDTKKEFFRLGGTAKEAANYSGAENQYALGLRMDELRAEYEAGRTAQLSGEGSGQPTDSLLGETGIATSDGYRKGVELAKSEQREQEFKNRMGQTFRASEREAIRGETDAERLDKAIAFGASRPEVPLNFNQPIDKIEQDQAEAARMEAHNIDRMKAGLNPLPVSESLYTSGMQPKGTGTARRLILPSLFGKSEPSIAKPTEGSFRDVFNAEQSRTLGTARGQAEATTGGRIEGQNNEAASRALSDENLPKEYQDLRNQPDFVKKYGALMAQYYENQALGQAGDIQNKKAIALLAYKDSEEIIKGAESLGIKPETDKDGLVTPGFKSSFLSGYDKVSVREEAIDPDTQEKTYFTTAKWQKRREKDKDKNPNPMNLNPADANKTPGGKKFWLFGPPAPERK